MGMRTSVASPTVGPPRPLFPSNAKRNKTDDVPLTLLEIARSGNAASPTVMTALANANDAALTLIEMAGKASPSFATSYGNPSTALPNDALGYGGLHERDGGLPTAPVFPPVPVTPAASKNVRLGTSVGRTQKTVTKRATMIVDPRRPFGCPYEGCGARFNKKHHLTAHVRSTHKVQRPHQCNVTGCTSAGFQSPFGLKPHVQTVHLKTRNYHCPFPGCLKSFGQRSYFTRHVQNTNLHRGSRQ